MMHRFSRYWLPVIAYAGIIFYYSSLTQPLGEFSLFLHADKFIHFFEFAFLGLLLRRAILSASAPYFRERSLFWTIILGIIYAFSDEFHQSFVPGRNVTCWDLIFDTFGILASLFVRLSPAGKGMRSRAEVD